MCKRPLTIGVENRVIDLSEKILSKDDVTFVKNAAGVTFVGDKEKKRRPFVSLIPLLEVCVELQGGSQVKGYRQYEHLLETFGTEFDILLRKSYEEIEAAAGKQLSEAVKRIRDREVYVDPGFDGVFGKVEIFHKHGKKENEKESSEDTEQTTLF